MKLKIFSNFRNPDTDPFFENLRNKFGNAPITIFYDIFPKSNSDLSINPYNFLFIHEPNEFFGLHDAACVNNNLFTSIITWSDLICKRCDNSILFTYNGRTLDFDFINNIKNTQKTFEVSFLCGTKKIVAGHKLRHSVYEVGTSVNIPKKWNYVMDDYDHNNDARPGYSEYSKDLSHIPKDINVIGYGRRSLYEKSMYNIVIENVNHLNWYNKIGDSFLANAIPIYWGCPNIEDFGYSERGIIRFGNEHELVDILNNLTAEVYHDMMPYIEHNYQIAIRDELYGNFDIIINEFLKLNNINI